MAKNTLGFEGFSGKGNCHTNHGFASNEDNIEMVRGPSDTSSQTSDTSTTATSAKKG